MKIIEPEEKYLISYLEGCKEIWDNVHDRYIIHNPDVFDKRKNSIFQDFENAKNGINLPPGFIPNTTYWIIDKDNYIGTINVRFQLNDALSKYGGHAGIVIRPKYRKQGYALEAGILIINELKKHNINSVLLTTEERNKAAIRCLEKLNPYKMEKDTAVLNEKLTKIRRYYYN